VRVVCAPERFRDGGMGIQTIRTIAGRAVCVLAATAGFAATAAGVASAADPIACPAADICRADPFFESPPKSLGSPGAPDDDVLAALNALVSARQDGDEAGADEAKGRALAILLGDPTKLVAGDSGFLDRKAYGPGVADDGTPLPPIALLNTSAKVRKVPAGTTTVDVREVRYGDQALLDTSMLRFEDMNAEFTIRWHITELGTSFGGELAPVGIPASGVATQAAADDLVLPSLLTGTQARTQRFHPGGGPEETRLATQVVSVHMPGPKDITGGILDPNVKPGHETFAQIAVAKAVPDAPESEQPAPTMPGLDTISDQSPEKQILDGLNDGTDPAQLIDLVTKMRSRDTLPVGSLADTADAGVAFANSEASVSKRELRLAPNGTMTLALTNLDGIPRTVDIRQLTNRSQVDAAGVLNWGSFTTDVVEPVELPANMTEPKVVTVTPAGGAFSLWVGDPTGGDQAGMAIALDRGPRQQSLELGLGPVKPLHEALDKTGALTFLRRAVDFGGARSS